MQKPKASRKIIFSDKAENSQVNNSATLSSKRISNETVNNIQKTRSNKERIVAKKTKKVNAPETNLEHSLRKAKTKAKVQSKIVPVSLQGEHSTRDGINIEIEGGLDMEELDYVDDWITWFGNLVLLKIKKCW